MAEERQQATPIEDYALIGDCETAALVSRDGSVDWLCWPRFDSPSCFAALLGAPEHGRWRIAPRDLAPERTRRRYRGDTLVLETAMETPNGGAVAVIDFMPPRDGRSDLVRIVRGLRGRVSMRMELVLRFDHGRTVPWVTRMEDGDLRAVAGPHQVTLRTAVPTHGENLRTVADFEVGEGEEATFVLTHSPSHLPPPEPADCRRQLDETEAFWTDWMGTCPYRHGAWAPAVRRSLLTLKALTYRPTGGIVAAPTTSLPEVLGGSRNWDYRYCWLRDSALLLTALTGAGFLEEAAAWRDWLIRAVAGSPDQVQIMYGVAGERLLTEIELPWLPGYAGSCPVRIGNGASGQVQLDVLGEVIDALFQAHRRGLGASATGWALARKIMEHLEETWRKPDHGIWEMRGPPQHFTHSKVMVWVAFDRMVRAVESLPSLDGPVERWRRVRDEVHAEVCEKGFDPGLGAYTQFYGSRSLDASLLLIPLVGFLPADDPRVRGTVSAIERGLKADGLLVRRYDTAVADDGLEQQDEGAFLACSFWLVEAMLLDGRAGEARALFERLLALANEVGLLAEEYDSRARRQVGNFPQAFSHVALVNAAFALAGVENPELGAAPPRRQG